MRRFYDEYQSVIIWQVATAKMEIVQSTIDGVQEGFWRISFTHHLLLLNKCKTNEERSFYIHQCANQFWSVRVLEHHLNANLFKTFAGAGGFRAEAREVQARVCRAAEFLFECAG
jgi:hypothetical protein